eukprot:TRINITY_DN2140_c0_g1_i1.p1 TRINITY_DN2140_c0_g1~~TRINITY_DN2140_c0_g1_i1.p1  ORF type:complete len:674 (+),score=266.48 TRINITY_DN2140_c0_g1_i1:90-2024(+)
MAAKGLAAQLRAALYSATPKDQLAMRPGQGFITVSVDTTPLLGLLTTVFGELMRIRQLFEKIQLGFEQLGKELDDRGAEARSLVQQCERRITQAFGQDAKKREEEAKRVQEEMSARESAMQRVRSDLERRMSEIARQSDQSTMTLRQELVESIARNAQRAEREREEAVSHLSTQLRERCEALGRANDAAFGKATMAVSAIGSAFGLTPELVPELVAQPPSEVREMLLRKAGDAALPALQRQLDEMAPRIADVESSLTGTTAAVASLATVEQLAEFRTEAELNLKTACSVLEIQTKAVDGRLTAHKSAAALSTDLLPLARSKEVAAVREELAQFRETQDRETAKLAERADDVEIRLLSLAPLHELQKYAGKDEAAQLGEQIKATQEATVELDRRAEQRQAEQAMLREQLRELMESDYGDFETFRNLTGKLRSIDTQLDRLDVQIKAVEGKLRRRRDPTARTDEGALELTDDSGEEPTRRSSPSPAASLRGDGSASAVPPLSGTPTQRRRGQQQQQSRGHPHRRHIEHYQRWTTERASERRRRRRSEPAPSTAPACATPDSPRSPVFGVPQHPRHAGVVAPPNPLQEQPTPTVRGRDRRVYTHSAISSELAPAEEAEWAEQEAAAAARMLQEVRAQTDPGPGGPAR